MTECEACRIAEEEHITHDEALRRLAVKDAHLVEQHGWVAHGIVGEEPSIHTHGLPESFDHLDLEIRLPAEPKRLYELLAPVVNAVKDGRVFRAGEEVSGLFNVPVRLVERTESGRPVLRVIFPDPQGRFPGDLGCLRGYAGQLEGGDA